MLAPGGHEFTQSLLFLPHLLSAILGKLVTGVAVSAVAAAAVVVVVVLLVVVVVVVCLTQFACPRCKWAPGCGGWFVRHSSQRIVVMLLCPIR